MSAAIFLIAITLFILSTSYRFGLLPILRVYYQRKLERVGERLAHEVSRYGKNLSTETAGLIIAAPYMVALNLKTISIPDAFFAPNHDGGIDPFDGTHEKIKGLGNQIGKIAGDWMILNSPFCFLFFFLFIYLPVAVFVVGRMVVRSFLTKRKTAKAPRSVRAVQDATRRIAKKPWSLAEANAYLDRRLFEPAQNSMTAQLAAA